MFLVILLIAFFVGHAATRAGGGDKVGGDHAAPAGGARVITPGSEAMAEFEREVMADPDRTEAKKKTQIAAARGRLDRLQPHPDR